ncbi:hypothetical protein GCM10009104_05760 [Marinobacterium maritimum]|uniref:Uncharacterized protein n=1 Tax=Marinobacterium maritimum TaxID=500162 RepID=A0ABN1I2L4_9GAMM
MIAIGGERFPAVMFVKVKGQTGRAFDQFALANVADCLKVLVAFASAE